MRDRYKATVSNSADRGRRRIAKGQTTATSLKFKIHAPSSVASAQHQNCVGGVGFAHAKTVGGLTLVRVSSSHYHSRHPRAHAQRAVIYVNIATTTPRYVPDHKENNGRNI
jgi:hypothetical protein